MIAAVRVRGMIGTEQSTEDTLRMLQLYRKNFCVILKDEPHIKGMLMKVKDFITWGELDDETTKLLQKKQGKLAHKYHRLNNPRKGFGRKGIKIPFIKGGALGDRKEKINDLIKRMI